MEPPHSSRSGRPRAARTARSTPEQRIGSWLAETRERQGISLDAVAAHAGVKAKTVRNVEAGARCSRRVADAYAALLGVDVDRVLGIDDGAARPWSEDASVRESLPDRPGLCLGRDRELAGIQSDFADGARLITIVGPVGVGKTHLATEAAHHLREIGAYREVVFVPLAEHSRRWLPEGGDESAGLAEERIVARAVLESAGRKIHAEPFETQQVAEAFEGRSVLVVLDNCETFVRGAGALARTLAEIPGGPCLLATSQRTLRVAGECVLEAVPLIVPADLPTATDPSELAGLPAVALFCIHAAELQLGPANAPVVCGILRSLDGLPLFIEYAARLVGTIGLTTVQRNLTRLVLAGRTSGDTRHTSAHTALEWAWDHLTPADRACLGVAAVFRGGFERDAFERVARGAEVDPEGLDGLLDRAIVRSEAASDRLALLQVFRQLVQKRSTAWLRDGARKAHAEYFIGVAEDCGAKLTGRDQVAATGRLEVERLNIEAAIAWSLSSNDARSALRAGAALWRWWARQDPAGGRRLLAHALELPRPGVDDRTVAGALLGAGHLSLKLAQYQVADELLLRALSMSDGSPDLAALAVMNRGMLREERGDPSCEALFLDALDRNRELGDERGVGHAINNLGMCALRRGDLGAAAAHFREAATLFESIGDIGSSALAYDNRGWTAWLTRDLVQAEYCYRLARDRFQGLGDRGQVSNVDVNLARMSQAQGDHHAAADRLLAAATTARSLRDRRCGAEVLIVLAASLRALGDESEAERLESAADAITRWSHIGLHDGVGPVVPAPDSLTTPRKILTADPFDAALRQAIGHAERLAGG